MPASSSSHDFHRDRSFADAASIALWISVGSGGGRDGRWRAEGSFEPLGWAL
jgi:hypothetical protein